MEDRNRSSVQGAELPLAAFNYSAMPVERASFRPNASSDLYDTSSFGIGHRYGSHRRRSSQIYSNMMPAGHLPAAPEVPQDPNSHQMNPQKHPDVRRRISPNIKSQRYEPQKGQNSQPQMSLNNTGTLDAVSPISPPTSEEVEKLIRQTEPNRTKEDPVPEQSPLQKLEGKLGDISKEEKRARMIKAESKYQNRAAINSKNTLGETSQKTTQSGAATGTSHVHPFRQRSPKRNIPKLDDQPPNNQNFKYGPRSGDGRQSRRIEAAVDRAVGTTTRNTYDYTDRRSFSTNAEEIVPGNNDRTSARVIGLGLYDTARQSPDDELGQSSSPANTRPGDFDHRSYHKTRSMGINQQNSQLIDREEEADATHQKVFSSSGNNKPELRQTVTFSENSRNDSSVTAAGTRKKSMGAYLGMNRGPLPLFKPQKALDEWRNAGRATLTAEDFDLVQPDATGNRNVAWWERKDFQRWRSNAQYNSVRNENAREITRRQTSFNPPLYLRCGPLLRYTGIHKAKPAQESWTGSVLIVTDDHKSSYTDPPVLRLFSQPMTPFPAPPEEMGTKTGQDLPPDYVDPVEGEIKSSRSGKTLYVKPVGHLEEYVDLSRIENDDGLFEEFPNTSRALKAKKLRLSVMDGEKANKYRQVRGFRLLCERGVTFWRFNIAVELTSQQTRVAYRINNGPATGFWIPSKGSPMNIMFHSCNGFSTSVNPNEFSGPDPLWRDVLNSHQFKPFHVMIGGGDQIYMDAVVQKTVHFRNWMGIKDIVEKQSIPFSREMQEELEDFYMRRYCTWFSSGLFALANAQIPMINIWDDHDLLDGYGSYSHYSMSSPVFLGIGAIAFKYYMLFQHQSLSQETQRDEPSWQLGAAPGPYIQERSRSVYVSLGRQIAFLGLDCRTERMRDEILTPKSYDLIFDRLRKEIVSGVTKHLIVLLGVPIAYPRLNFLENVISSRAFEPIKALGKAGLMGNFLNKLDGGVEVLDDLDDHWTAKHHKRERNWLIEELQELALEKSVRITILGGDVHLAAVGQFYSNKKLGLPKDRDHRYMPNVISSAIANTSPPDTMADIINQRNRVHHLDTETDEDMIPMFLEDVDGRPRRNTHLLPRRNWCAIREYFPGSTPLPSPSSTLTTPEQPEARPGLLSRTNSLSRRDFRPATLARRLSRGTGPPVSFRGIRSSEIGGLERRRSTSDADTMNVQGSYFPQQPLPHENNQSDQNLDDNMAPPSMQRPVNFLRRPTNLSEKALRQYHGGNGPDTKTSSDNEDGHINLEGGLEVTINAEVVKGDPAGITTPYKLLIPALLPFNPPENSGTFVRRKGRMDNLLQGLKGAGGFRRTSTAPILHRQGSKWDQQELESGESIPKGEEVTANGSSEDQAGREVTRQQSSLNHHQIFQGESFRAESNQRVSSYRLSRKVDQSQDRQNDAKGNHRGVLNTKETNRRLNLGQDDISSEDGDDDSNYRTGFGEGGDGHAARKPSYRRNVATDGTDGLRRQDNITTSQAATATSTSRAASNLLPKSPGARVGERITAVGTDDDLYRDDLGDDDYDDDAVQGYHRQDTHGDEPRDRVGEEDDDNDDYDDDLDIDERYENVHAKDPPNKTKIGSRYLLDAIEDYSRSEEKERPAYGQRFKRWSWKNWK